MHIYEILENMGITQVALARIISGGTETINKNARVKANRIWHGKKPNNEEMQLIYKATNGKVDANIFAGLYNKKIRKD